VINHRDSLHCIDSTCYHTGGPLGNGDIEEVNGEACIVCPWHMYQIALQDGGKYYKPLLMGPDQKMVPGDWKKKPKAQRTHFVRKSVDAVFVKLNKSDKYDSDVYGRSSVCGQQLVQGLGKNGSVHIHSKRTQSLPKRSGHVLTGSEGSQSLHALTSNVLMEENETYTSSSRPVFESTVESIVAEAEDALALSLSLPEGQRSEILHALMETGEDYGDGSIVTTEDVFETWHVELGMMVDQEFLFRPYTPIISMRRTVQQIAMPLKFLLRIYKNGIFTQLMNALKLGDKVLIRAGARRKAAQLHKKVLPDWIALKRIVLFAGGSGVTPILQIIQNALDQEVTEAPVAITLVCVNKSKKRAIGLGELEKLADERFKGATLQILHLETGSQTAHELKGGLLQALQIDSSPSVVYAWCGPLGLLETLRNVVLRDFGIAEERCIEFSS